MARYMHGMDQVLSKPENSMQSNLHPAPLDRSIRCVGWETRYQGILSVAVVDGVQVAGISGPWPDGHYALTWWASYKRDALPKLECYSTLGAARHRVEQFAIAQRARMAA
jgi:hypothetical protein